MKVTRPHIALVLFWSVSIAPALAHIPRQYNSVHFHSGMPDFGTPPRRAILYFRREPDDRPLKHASGYVGPRVGVELTDDGDTSDARAAMSIEQRLKEEMGRLVVSAEAYEKTGQWTRARSAREQIAQRFGWTGNLRDRVEVLRQVEGMKRPVTEAQGLL